MSKPEAGQWWFNCGRSGSDAKRNGVCVHSVLTKTQVLLETVSGYFEVWRFEDLEGWHYEPRCTGWDWVVPEDQPQPAEDPDEWVILDPVKYSGHVLRKNIDFTNTCTGWEPISIWGGDTIGGVMNDYKGERVLFRCRRRDLPKVEQVRTESESDHVPDATKKISDESLELIVHLRDQMQVLANRVAECERVVFAQTPRPQKKPIRLWVDSDCNIHAGLKGDGDLELHYDHEMRQFYTEEQL